MISEVIGLWYLYGTGITVITPLGIANTHNHNGAWSWIMATSQYLRPAGLLEVTKSYLTPDVVRHASSAIGEPESATRQSLLSAVPTVLSGVTRMASSPQGASGLSSTLREGGFESVVSNPSALFTSGSSASRIAVLGQQLVSRIFGSKSSMVSDAVAKSSGVSTNSANRVLSFAAPLVMGVLSRHVISQGLNATGLSSLLADQKDEISNATPPGVLRVLDSSGPTMVPSTTSAGAVPKDLYREGHEEFSQMGRTALPQTTGGGRIGWLPWLLFALVGLGLLFFLRGRPVQRGVDVATQQTANAGKAIGNAAGQAAGALTSLTLPGGVHLSVPAGSINDNLATFLASSAPAPRTFIFDHLNFESSSTDLTPASVPTVNALGSILKAYPNSRVQLAGYTDNTGDPQANRTLSLNRALAVRSMLMNQGIGSERVVAIGLGEDHPAAPNDTEEGRARNRRLELTVTAK